MCVEKARRWSFSAGPRLRLVSPGIHLYRPLALSWLGRVQKGSKWAYARCKAFENVVEAIPNLLV